MNDIERVRIKVGLTKPQMMELLKENADGVILKPAQALSIFTLSEKELVEKVERRAAGTPSSLIRRALEIEEYYDAWYSEVMERLEALAERSEGILRTRDTARILGISDFHLSQLRHRGTVDAVQESQRRWVYTLPAIKEFVENNSKAISSETRKTRGPLTNAFLSWMEERMAEGELVATA